jgi:hypothetical protein
MEVGCSKGATPGTMTLCNISMASIDGGGDLGVDEPYIGI